MNRKALLPLGLALVLAALAMRTLIGWEGGRAVDMLVVFAGAFGAGAALTAAVLRGRAVQS